MIPRSGRRPDASDRPATKDVSVLLADVPANADGSAPWRDGREIDGTRLELIERIVAAYGVDRDRAAVGADLYLRQLRSGGLLAEY
jgi:hypothetical protein